MTPFEQVRHLLRQHQVSVYGTCWCGMALSPTTVTIEQHQANVLVAEGLIKTEEP